MLEERRLLSAADLDPTFGAGGKSLTDLPGSLHESARAAAVQEDGKVIVVGAARPDGAFGDDFLVARFNPDGTPDPSFGGGAGYVLVDFGVRHDIANAVALAPGGKIVVAGSTSAVDTNTIYTPQVDFAVARLNGDGTLDTSFSADGREQIDFGADADVANAVVVRPDARIVLGGVAGSRGGFATAALLPDGAFDTSFARTGKAQYPIDSTNGRVNGIAAMTLDAGGGIVAAGVKSDSFGPSTRVARFLPDGSLDVNFAAPGAAVAYLGLAAVTDIEVAPNGAVLAAGSAGSAGGPAVARFMPGAGGSDVDRFLTHLDSLKGVARSVTALADGRILAGGSIRRDTTTNTTPESPLVWRLLPDGSSDPSFSGGAALPDDPPGAATNGVGTVVAVVPQPGGSSLSVGTGSFPTPGGNAGAIDFNSSPDLVLTRRLGNGALDPTFAPGGADGLDGVEILDLVGPGADAAARLVSLPGGKTLALGSHWNGAGTGQDLVLARYNADGSSDTSFGAAGTGLVYSDDAGRRDIPTSLVTRDDGSILVSGLSRDQAFGARVELFRFDRDGRPDSSFGTAGKVTIARSSSGLDRVNYLSMVPLDVQEDGRILVAFSLGSGTNGGADAVLMRLTPSGEPDPTFTDGANGPGIVRMPAGTRGFVAAVAVTPGGKYVVVTNNNPSPVATTGGSTVARINPDGSLDNTFYRTVSTPSGGYFFLRDSFTTDVVVGPTGEITIGGVNPSAPAGQVYIERRLADGLIDTSFGDIPPGSAGRSGRATTFGADTLSDLALLADGSVVAAGTAYRESIPLGEFDPRLFGDFAVVRTTPNGTLDAGFGHDPSYPGVSTIDFAARGDSAAAVAVDEQGRIVLGGAAYVPGHSTDIGLARLQGSGPLPLAVEAAWLGSGGWGTQFRSALAGAGVGGAAGYVLSREGAPRPLPWSTLDRVSIRFNSPADAIGRDDLRVRGTNVADYAISDFAYDPASRTATWRLAGPLENDRLVIELDTGADPAAEFRWNPSVLTGDSTGDGAVNANDLGDLKRRLNRSLASPGSGTGAYSLFADVTGDGRINALDLGAVKQRLNRRLPAAAPGTTNVASVTKELFGSVPILPA